MSRTLCLQHNLFWFRECISSRRNRQATQPEQTRRIAMTRNWMNSIVFAASVVLTAGAASAQDSRIEVKIPFEFRAPGVTLPAGHYRLTEDRTAIGARIFRLSNVDTNRTAFTYAAARLTAKPSQQDQAYLSFHCVDQSCQLAEAWTGNTIGYRFRVDPQSAPAGSPLAQLQVKIVRAE
jgi:hypothetical protein